MLCSVSTPTPTTCSISVPNQKPPNWLDRLHLSKGFSLPSPDLHLDHFLLLSHPDSDPGPSLPPPPPPPPPPSPPKNEPSDSKPASRGRKKHLPLPSSASSAADDKRNRTQLVDLMSSALAELFVMGGPRPAAAFKKRKKKGARKQPNPRTCNPSSAASASVDEGGRDRPAATPPSSADNSVAEANKKNKNGRTKGRKKRAPVGGHGELDLSAYSRTEVTVIDSSVPGWKSEKVIFRKGMFWKVRDKKARIFSKKKRKLGLVERLAGEKKKKEPLDDSKLPVEPLQQGRNYADKRATSKEVDCTLVSARRKFARSPRMPLGRNAPILHLQAIAGVNKKNEPSGSGPEVTNNR